MTGYGDIPMCVRAMKAGAVDFLSKPFRDQDMIDAVTAAINRDGLRRASENRAVAVVDHYASLSPREREVMALVTAGKMNKQIAAELGLSEVTVKIHRGAAMRKIGRPFAGGSRAHGGRTGHKEVYLTSGAHDILLLAEAPLGDHITKFALAVLGSGIPKSKAATRIIYCRSVRPRDPLRSNQIDRFYADWRPHADSHRDRRIAACRLMPRSGARRCVLKCRVFGVKQKSCARPEPHRF